MKKTMSIIGASVAAVAFGAILVGSTTALFTAERTTSVHLQAGNLTAKLYMTSLVRDVIDEDGYIQTEEVDLTTWEDYYVEDRGVDLERYQDAIFSDILIVPGMSGEAKFALYNEGDIAFNYYVTPTTHIEQGEELYDDLELEYPTEDDNDVLAKNASVEFTVSYLFRDDDDPEEIIGLNNDAMGETVTIDFSIFCVQVTKQNA